MKFFSKKEQEPVWNKPSRSEKKVGDFFYLGRKLCKVNEDGSTSEVITNAAEN